MKNIVKVGDKKNIIIKKSLKGVVLLYNEYNGDSENVSPPLANPAKFAMTIKHTSKLLNI